MPASSFRLVLDTNVLLAGLTSASSASQRIVDALQRRWAVPLLSPNVLAEYRAVFLHPKTLERFPQITPRLVAVVIQRLCYIGDEYGDIRVKFSFPRDPLDAKFIELAIVGNASHVVTMDHDLLSLAIAATDAGKRFRQRCANLKIMSLGDFLVAHGRDIEPG